MQMMYICIIYVHREMMMGMREREMMTEDDGKGVGLEDGGGEREIERL